MKLLKKRITRRQFLKYVLAGAGTLALGSVGYKHLFASRPSIFRGDAPETLWKWSKEAYHYRKYGDNVQCLVCPNQCLLEPDDRSICRNKVNKDGKLYTLAYGNPASVHIDPIEKKPLFHFLPGSKAFSLATAGCNFRCLNCQNWTLSQFKPEELRNYDAMPEKIVAESSHQGCASIAYTYSEPTAFYEYMYDTSKLAAEKGIKNLWITNGYMNQEPLQDLCKYLDAANVDLKSFDESIYQELNQGHLKPILTTLKILKELGKWIEITNLLVPSWTDSLDMIKEMTAWLYKNGFKDYPLHFSRFSPMYKLTHLPPTSPATLKKAREIAMESGLNFVYIGNLPGSQDTYCPGCQRLLISRTGYTVKENNIQQASCRFCGEKVAGIWS